MGVKQKCLGTEKSVEVKQTSSVEQGKCSMCQASVKFNRCRVNSQWVPSSVQVLSNTICVKYKYFNNVEFLNMRQVCEKT